MKELLDRAFDGPLDEAEERALAELLRRDDAAVLRYLELARDEALLAEAVVEARARRALAPAEGPRARWGVAAALLLAALTLFLAPPEPAPAPLLPPGGGLRAEYFDGTELARPRAARIDAFLDFHWSVRPPDPAVAAGPWSARWSGTLRPRSAGPHALHVASDDGCRLWIGERLVLDHWKDQTRTERTAELTLDGDPVAIRLEYFNREGPGALRLAWTAPGRAKELVPPDVLAPAPPGGGGLRGAYFDGLDTSEATFTRADPLIDFAWGLGGPGGAVDNFRVVWTGSLVPRRSGPMTLSVVSDDGCRLWIDGRLVIDDWTVRGTEERSAAVELQAGRRHALRLEYFERVATARCSLYWSGPEQPRELIPSPCLYPE